MATCDRCFDGRHVRCMGRGDCTCNVCSVPRSARDHKNMVRIRSGNRTPQPRTGARKIVHETPPDWITVNEFEVAKNVLVNLQSLVDTKRCERDMTVVGAAEEMGIPHSQLGRFLRGELAQGFTANTLVKILDWGATC